MIPYGILLPVKRKYSKLILDGKKIAEVRKQIPKINLPCQVYIYESFGTQRYVSDELWGDKYPEWFGYEIFKEFKPFREYFTQRLITEGRGSIVARFTLESIETINPDWEESSYDVDDDLLNDLKLSIRELINYGHGEKVYAWRISNLKIVNEIKLSDIDVKHAPQSIQYLSQEQVNELDRLNDIPF